LYIFYSSLGKIVSFYGKIQTIILPVYISCSFTLVVCGGKNISSNLINSQEPEPHVLAPWSRSLGKKLGAGAAWKKKSRTGAAKK